jgi:hypothetical protein
VCVLRCRARTRLELRLRTDGEALITDIRAAPVIPGSPETEALYSQGFQPTWVDLGDLSLASGLQLWIKQDIKPRDVETLLLQDRLAATKCVGMNNDLRIRMTLLSTCLLRRIYTPRLQHVIDMLQLTKVQVDILLDKFNQLDHDQDGIVLLQDWYEEMVRIGAQLVKWFALSCLR